MKRNITEYKLKKLSVESFKNALRLHFDSIVLYNNKSYPSAFQLSVLSIEEFGKSEQVEWYYFTLTTNEWTPDVEFEQKFLNDLYIHPIKQRVFFNNNDWHEYSPKFIKFIYKRDLEKKKQKATYVGLERIRKGNIIDVNSRISIPTSICQKDAQQMISIIRDYLKNVCRLRFFQESYFDIDEKDDLITKSLLKKIDKWKHRSGLKSKKHLQDWHNIKFNVANL